MGKRKDRIREQAEMLAKKYNIKYTDDGKYFTIHDKVTGKQLTDDDLLDSGEWGILKRKQKLLNKYLEAAAGTAIENMESTEGAGNASSNVGNDNNGSGNTGNSNEEYGAKKNDDEIAALVSTYEAKLKEQSDMFTKKLNEALTLLNSLNSKVSNMASEKGNATNKSASQLHGGSQNNYWWQGYDNNGSTMYSTTISSQNENGEDDVEDEIIDIALDNVKLPAKSKKWRLYELFSKAHRDGIKYVRFENKVYDVKASLEKSPFGDWKPVPTSHPIYYNPIQWPTSKQYYNFVN